MSRTPITMPERCHSIQQSEDKKIKKLITLLMVTLALCIMAIPCLAADIDVPSSEGHDVYARYSYAPDHNVYPVKLVDGSYSFKP